MTNKNALLIIVLVIAGLHPGQAQNAAATNTNKKHNSIQVSSVSIAFTNSHTALPFGSFSKLFSGPIHPGIEAGTEITWSEKKKHDWFQSFRIGYTYHRLVQHSIVLYTEFGYRYKLPYGFAASIKLGGGYMKAIVANQVFADGQGSQVQYSKAAFGRSQANIMTTLSIAKEIGQNGFKAYLEYQQRLQTPFIQAYVDILPYNIILAGISIPIKKNN